MLLFRNCTIIKNDRMSWTFVFCISLDDIVLNIVPEAGKLCNALNSYKSEMLLVEFMDARTAMQNLFINFNPSTLIILFYQ